MTRKARGLQVSLSISCLLTGAGTLLTKTEEAGPRQLATELASRHQRMPHALTARKGRGKIETEESFSVKNTILTSLIT